IPVAIRLFLIVCGDLEGKRLVVLEGRAAVETETRNAEHGESHRQHIALLATRVIGRRFMNGGDFTIRKTSGGKTAPLLRILVVPQANGVFGFHLRVLPLTCLEGLPQRTQRSRRVRLLDWRNSVRSLCLSAISARSAANSTISSRNRNQFLYDSAGSQ